jgi:hypothetical protein
MYEAPGSMLGTAALSPARVIRAFTALRPQCPVQLHTIRYFTLIATLQLPRLCSAINHSACIVLAHIID